MAANDDTVTLEFRNPTADHFGLNGFMLSQVGGVIIPEPSTFIIWALGLVGLAAYARRRRTK